MLALGVYPKRYGIRRILPFLSLACYAYELSSPHAPVGFVNKLRQLISIRFTCDDPTNFEMVSFYSTQISKAISNNHSLLLTPFKLWYISDYKLRKSVSYVNLHYRGNFSKSWETPLQHRFHNSKFISDSTLGNVLRYKEDRQFTIPFIPRIKYWIFTSGEPLIQSLYYSPTQYTTKGFTPLEYTRRWCNLLW